MRSFLCILLLMLATSMSASSKPVRNVDGTVKVNIPQGWSHGGQGSTDIDLKWDKNPTKRDHSKPGPPKNTDVTVVLRKSFYPSDLNWSKLKSNVAKRYAGPNTLEAEKLELAGREAYLYREYEENSNGITASAGIQVLIKGNARYYFVAHYRCRFVRIKPKDLKALPGEADFRKMLSSLKLK